MSSQEEQVVTPPNHALAKSYAPVWVLEGDIKSCFVG